jgi:hypothetical protein
LSADGSQLLWATYFGTSDWDIIRDLDIDIAGNLYVGVSATSAPFPAGIITANAFQPQIRGGRDGAVAKLSPDASQVLYASYWGGSATDGEAPSIRVDAAGIIYLLAATESSDTPTTANAVQSSHGGGQADLFLSKIDPHAATGSAALLYATYFGGSGHEGGETHYLAIDSAGKAYLGASTASPDLPIQNKPGLKKTLSGSRDATVAIIDTTQSGAAALIAGTYLGGAGIEGTQGIFVDAAGYVYIGGPTTSVNFPTTPDAYQTHYGGGPSDGYVVKLAPLLDQLLYSSYLGGTDEDEGRSLAINSARDILSVGQSASANFPIQAFDAAQPAFQPIYGGGSGDAILARFVLTPP